MHKSRSIRRSGHPTYPLAASRLRAVDRDLISGGHYGQRPAQSAASTGRTDGSTDQHCITAQKSLANREPSTDGGKADIIRRKADMPTQNVCFQGQSGRSGPPLIMSAYSQKQTFEPGSRSVCVVHSAEAAVSKDRPSSRQRKSAIPRRPERPR